ncbi:UPF0147 family protein [Candidatus Woesearchaeota archaeon]|nr:UPF0147 family protein [Candidatus Woesearchaeota archaeon]
MEAQEKVVEVLNALNDLLEDETVPKNVVKKIKIAITILENDEEEINIKVHKALNELDELADDVNMQSYVRTQLWNIISALEAI